MAAAGKPGHGGLTSGRLTHKHLYVLFAAVSIVTGTMLLVVHHDAGPCHRLACLRWHARWRGQAVPLGRSRGTARALAEQNATFARVEPAGTLWRGARAQDTASTPAPGTPALADATPAPGAPALADAAGAPAAGFPILMFCNNRPALLNDTLTSLLRVRGVRRERIVASQDGANGAVAAMLDAWGIERWQHERVELNEKGKRREGAELIADHYKWAIDRAFAHFGRSAAHLVIAEDDMLFAPDFMEYFVTLAPLLERDPTLWTISAFNDNGFAGRVWDPTRVVRTEWTVGFGWLLRRRLWEDELRDKWPKTHWDHWMRDNKRRKGRETLFPEVSRDYHTGARGTHSEPGLFERYFRNIVLSNASAPLLMGGELDALTADRYETELDALLARARPVRELDELAVLPTVAPGASAADPARQALALYYAARDEKDKVWERVATWLGLWHTIPARGIHKGLVRTGHRGHALLLIASWSPYAARHKPADVQPIAAEAFVNKGGLARLTPGWMARAGAELAGASTGVLRRPHAPPERPLPLDEATLAARRASTAVPEGVGTRLQAARFESCDQACARRMQRCASPAALAALNTCEQLRAEFGCEGGCHASSGADQPAYVALDAPMHFQPGACLANTVGNASSFSCGGFHAHTFRLCACAAARRHGQPGSDAGGTPG